MNTLRWGILSTANIASKNWKAIHASGNSMVTAVASRDRERGRDFIGKCQAEAAFETPPTALNSYEELLASKEMDAVYIPLPTGLRKPWVLRTTSTSNHVLCEKPFGLNLADVEEMVAACGKNGVQFMDGVMFMHNPRLERLRELLDDGASVGRIKRIMSIFTFCVGEDFFRGNIRVHSELEPTGCLGDLGCYCLRLSLLPMNWQLPREVTGRVRSQRGNALSPALAPTDFIGELILNEETAAGFYRSFLAEKQQWADVSGTKGHFLVSDFVHPFGDHEPAFALDHRDVRVKCCDCTG